MLSSPCDCCVSRNRWILFGFFYKYLEKNMIVICPNCNSKYSVHPDALGEEKLVRCAMCSTTWMQKSFDQALEKASATMSVFHRISWTLFLFCVSLTVFSIFFAKRTMISFWPPLAAFYETVGISSETGKEAFVIQNVSNFFVQKGGELYMGLKGEILNKSSTSLAISSVTIQLKDSSSDTVNLFNNKQSSYKKEWIHNLVSQKILPNEKVCFETELQKVPYNDLVCDIKINV